MMKARKVRKVRARKPKLSSVSYSKAKKKKPKVNRKRVDVTLPYASYLP